MLLLLYLAEMTASAKGRKTRTYSIAFYNQENLFDTIHDVGKNDYEYLPGGKNKWDTQKYLSKLNRMARVLSELSTRQTPQGPAVIGLAEVENRRVLEDLLRQPALSSRKYGIIHEEGPDIRGIDCAFLYDSVQFRLEKAILIPYKYREDTLYKTRGFLLADGFLAAERLCLIVNHWPSRAAQSPAREWAAEQVRAIKDSLLREDPKLKIIIMGDMNDDPADKSMSFVLGAKKERKQVNKHDLYNPWWAMLEAGQGTLKYRGKWNLFDQIVVNGNLLKKNKRSLKYAGAEIFMPGYLFQQEGKYKGYPLRTHAAGEWLDGYSDHLPVQIYLVKKTKK